MFQPACGQRLLAGDLVAAPRHVDEALAAEEVGALGIADRDDALVEAFFLRALLAGHDQPAAPSASITQSSSRIGSAIMRELM